MRAVSVKIGVALFASLTWLSLSAAGTALELKSTAFSDGAAIPARYSCDGADVSPPLAWSGAPAGTKSFALIAEDPDAPAGTWTHWIVYDLPPRCTGLPAAIPKGNYVPGGGKQGLTSFRSVGYGGPCPPSGRHRYFFFLYALDRPTGLPAGASKEQLRATMKGHILAEACLMGTYARK